MSKQVAKAILLTHIDDVHHLAQKTLSEKRPEVIFKGWDDSEI